MYKDEHGEALSDNVIDMIIKHLSEKKLFSSSFSWKFFYALKKYLIQCVLLISGYYSLQNREL